MKTFYLSFRLCVQYMREFHPQNQDLRLHLLKFHIFISDVPLT